MADTPRPVQIDPPTPPVPPIPPTILSVAGLVALVAMAALDAFAPGWDPETWVYLVAVLMVWGPSMLSVLGSRK